jgi:thioredoxin-like negative regulator of GroEL
MEPNVDRLAGEVAESGEAKVFKADVDKLAEIAGRFSVKTVPTLIVFSGGKETVRKTGTKPYRTMKKMLLGK